MEDEIKIIYEKPRKRYRHENSEKGEKRLRENGKKEREELEERLEIEIAKKRWYKDICKNQLEKLRKVEEERNEFKRNLDIMTSKYGKLEEYAWRLSKSIILNHKVITLDEDNKALRYQIRKNKIKNESDDEEPN